MSDRLVEPGVNIAFYWSLGEPLTEPVERKIDYTLESSIKCLDLILDRSIFLELFYREVGNC